MVVSEPRLKRLHQFGSDVAGSDILAIAEIAQFLIGGDIRLCSAEIAILFQSEYT